jgi:Zn-dependent peptidase ImmA (M78 family)
VTAAAQLASLLLDRFKISGKPDLNEICRALGLRITEKEFSGFEGVLVRGKNAQKGVIGINRSIRESSRKRFTIAHEIGHFVIPYHQRLETACTAGVIDQFGRGLTRAELEANEFASELLLPSKIVRDRLDLGRPSLANVASVANDFDTSLSATTWRFLDLTDLPCAMVWSQAGKATWYRTSEALPVKLPLSDLPAPLSVAGRLFAGEEIIRGAEEVEADLWFYPGFARRIKLLLEDSIPLPNYAAVFTLLWVLEMEQSVGAEAEVEMLEELEPDEFTIRRTRWPR